MPDGNLTYRRGEIWWVDLEPIIGRETGKKRPRLILQNDVGNKQGGTTIVAPLLPGKKTYPFVVNIEPTEQNGLDKDRNVDFGQMRAVDSRRVTNKLGILEDTCWEQIEKAVCVELGFSLAFKSS